MRNWILLITISGVSCGIFARQNPLYCDSDGACTNGQTCNLALHLCQTPGLSDLGPSGPFTLTAITPSVASTAGGDIVTLTGTDFSSNMTVLFNGTPSPSVTTVSSTQLRVTVPSRSGDCGPATVTLADSRGTNPYSNLFRFRLGSIAFTAQGSLPAIPAKAGSLAVFDANLDQKYDLVVGDPMDVTTGISVYLGSGNYGFQPPANYDPKGVSADFISADDIDGNGSADLLYYSPHAQTGGVGYLLNDGLGGFSKTAAITFNNIKPIMAIGALFSKGASKFYDLIFTPISNVSNNKHFLPDLLNASGATVQSSTSGWAAMLVNDFNGDKEPDLALVNKTVGLIYVYSGNGTADFTAVSGSPFSTRQIPSLAATGDFNGDSKIDFVIANSDATGTVDLALGQGDGTFTIPPSVALAAAAANPRLITSGDLDCDGQSDVIVSSTSGQSIIAYLAQGSGSSLSFSAGPSYNLLSGTDKAKVIVAAPFGSNNLSKKDIVVLVTPSVGAAYLVLLKNDSH